MESCAPPQFTLRYATALPSLPTDEETEAQSCFLGSSLMVTVTRPNLNRLLPHPPGVRGAGSPGGVGKTHLPPRLPRPQGEEPPNLTFRGAGRMVIDRQHDYDKKSKLLIKKEPLRKMTLDTRW